MYAIASTTVSVLRGTTTNAWGDVLDDDNATPVYTGLLAALSIERTQRHNPANQDVRTIRSISCAMQSNTDVREGDRLLDERTGALYAIESVTAPLGPAMSRDLQLVLTLVS